MSKPIKVDPGDRFGKWKVLEVIHKLHKHTMCRCRCVCGTERLVELQNLRQKKSKNCGCVRGTATSLRNTKHGFAKRGKTSRLYRIWAAIKTRCTNDNFPHYKDYGGRGISVCPEWADDFAVFQKWAMANGYRDDLTIERDKVDGDYEPSNCCWIPLTKQSRNRRDTKMLTALGETKGIADWAEDHRCRVSYSTLRSRVYRDGWPHEEAIATPKTHKHLRGKNTVA